MTPEYARWYYDQKKLYWTSAGVVFQPTDGSLIPALLPGQIYATALSKQLGSKKHLMLYGLKVCAKICSERTGLHYTVPKYRQDQGTTLTQPPTPETPIDYESWLQDATETYWEVMSAKK